MGNGYHYKSELKLVLRLFLKVPFVLKINELIV